MSYQSFFFFFLRTIKDCGILPLAKCNVSEYTCTDGTDLTYVGLRLDYSHGDETDRLIFAAGSTSDKAQWLVDLSQVRRGLMRRREELMRRERVNDEGRS